MCAIYREMNDVNYEGILRLLPHRYPFILVDRVQDVVLGESAVGIKNITLNEGVFQGHFPKDPIFPGVLIVEAMAQTAAVLALLSRGEEAASQPGSVYFMTIDAVKFRKPVRPGDVLEMHVVKVQMHQNIWRFRGEAFVRRERMAEAEFMAMLR